MKFLTDANFRQSPMLTNRVSAQRRQLAATRTPGGGIPCHLEGRQPYEARPEVTVMRLKYSSSRSCFSTTFSGRASQWQRWGNAA
jgi:hypothetical protein